MIWLLPLSFTLAIALAIAISSSFSLPTGLLSIIFISVSAITIKKDVSCPKKHYSGLLLLILLSMFLNKLIKANAAFPVSLFYIISLSALSYFIFRTWDDYTQRK